MATTYRFLLRWSKTRHRTRREYHYTPEGLQKDAQRTAFLPSEGIKMIHFTNTRVFKERINVLKEIKAALGE